jgi:23S rRNA (guanine1835-N2)-methyltransferase
MESNYSFSQLIRYPRRSREYLRAWDAADEYLLDTLFEFDISRKRILILNDQFGALASQLRKYDITAYTDSFVSSKAILINTEHQIKPINHLDQLSGLYDFVLIRVSKNLAFFNDQLATLTSFVHQDTRVLSGFMVKYFTPSIYENLEKYIGPIEPGLARKKARVVQASFKGNKVETAFPSECLIEGFEHSFLHHSNLFSREKLDIGTRFLLEHIPQGDFLNILDLGCANGIVGIKAKLLNPKASITFCDESAMAILSAKENFSRFFPGQESEAVFIHTNCYEDGQENYFDLVLCNPPFHQGTVVGDHIAVQMFQDAKKALRSGGLLRVIGNSHLGYNTILKRIYKNCKILATNKKFNIMDAQNS